MEQIKGLFTKNPVRQLNRIPPTIGLNGISISRFLLCCSSDSIPLLVATIDIDGYHVIFWDVGGHVFPYRQFNRYLSFPVLEINEIPLVKVLQRCSWNRVHH